MLDWRIYYADGSTFSSDDGTWDEAPQDNLIAVLVRDDMHGRKVLHGLDHAYSVLDGGPEEIAQCNSLGPQLHLRCPWLKFGVQTSNENFKKILDQATNDPDFTPPIRLRRRVEDGC